MLSGSCLCGQIAYEVDSTLGPIVHCHCRSCRKAHATAFSTISNVPRAAFRWVRGEAGLASYESSPGKFRRFCRSCGSQLIVDRPAQPTLVLRLGCLDSRVSEQPVVHIWRSDAADWYDPDLHLPQWSQGRPPG